MPQVLGLVTFILLTPMIVTSIQRMNTSVPVSPSSAFLGIKQIPKLFKGPEKVHFVSAIFVQILLQLGTVSWVTGFSELRAISLCIVDAILTAPTIVGGLTGILFLQIGAMSIVGLRGWLEQRIAKKEKEASEGGLGAIKLEANKKEGKKSDTMKTFGFDAHPGTEIHINEIPQRPELRERNTSQLLGREDSKIGFPTNFRRIGEGDGSTEVDYPDRNLFIDPTPYDSQNQRTYNHKIGGYETSPDSKVRHSEMITAYRPSSDIIVDDENLDRQYSAFAAERSPNPFQYPEAKPQLPRKSEDRDPVQVQRYRSFSRPTQGRQSEEVRVVYPGSEERMKYGMGFGYGK